MITGLYAALGAALIVWLSLRVIGLRRKHRVATGDGGNEELQIAIGTHANATQYLPIALILLLTLELAGAVAWLVHVFGAVLLAGRIIHARALPRRDMNNRVLGMQITLFTIAGLAAANVVLLAWRLLS